MKKNFFFFHLWVFSLLFTLHRCIKASVRAISVAGKLFKNRILQDSSVGISRHPGVEKDSSGHGLNDSKLIFSIFGPESENRPLTPFSSSIDPQRFRGSQAFHFLRSRPLYGYMGTWVYLGENILKSHIP